MAFQISLVDCSLESSQYSMSEQETMKRSTSGIVHSNHALAAKGKYSLKLGRLYRPYYQLYKLWRCRCPHRFQCNDPSVCSGRFECLLAIVWMAAAVAV